MKRLLFIGCVAFGACQSSVTEVNDFIPGVYVRFSQSQYSKAWDTLRITVYEKDPGTYVVQRYVGYQRILTGRLQPKEYTLSRSVTVLDESTQQLQDMKTGKLYTFSPERRTVLAGSAEYLKIN
jgi:hypothetical protein